MRRALLIDAFSAIHVGNGALIDNTYKFVNRRFPGEVDILTVDIKANIDRFPNVYEDIFSDYRKGLWGKISVLLSVLLLIVFEFPNVLLLNGALRLPWGRRLRKQLDLIDQADYCISLSGETINDHYFPHMYLRLVVYWLAILKGKKMVLFPQSIGPVFKPFSIWLLRASLGKSKYIVARDSQSLLSAKKIWEKCSAKIIFSPDVAVTQESKIEIVPGVKTAKKLIGITVSEIPRGEMGYEGEYLNKIVDVIAKKIDFNSYEFIVMPSNYSYQGHSNDYKSCLFVKEKLEKLGYDVSILENKLWHPDVYQGMQRNLFAFITTRMHVGILGTSAAVPTVMINTQHKIKAYMALIGMNECVVELNDLDDGFESVLEYVLKNNSSIRATLLSENIRLREQVEHMAMQVFES